MTNPLADPYFILTKVYRDGAFLKQAIADTPVEPLNKNRTIKICYGVLDKDVYLNFLIRANASARPKNAVATVIKIALYMLEFMGKHDYMVIDCAVELVKKLGKGGASGFVNAFLRGYKKPELPENPLQKLSVSLSCPEWLVKKVRRSYKGETQDILSAGSFGQCVRFTKNSEKYLSAEHIQTPFDGVYIFKNFERDEGFYSGDYTFQSVGSVAICNAIPPCKNLLDACAAPGGKSVLLAAKCKSVTACEIHPHRKKLIEEYARRMGVKNVAALLADSSRFNAEFENSFDTVLCDVPCSGTGVMGDNPDIKLRRREGDIAAICAVQSAILSNCARYVKRGGRLFYSTCSILPEENDSVAVEFLRNNKNFAPEIPDSPLGHKTTAYGLQFLPHISLGAGFYLTSFVKL